METHNIQLTVINNLSPAYTFEIICKAMRESGHFLSLSTSKDGVDIVTFREKVEKSTKG